MKLTGCTAVDAKNYTIHPALNKLSKARFSLPEAMSLLYCLDIVISLYLDPDGSGGVIKPSLQHIRIPDLREHRPVCLHDADVLIAVIIVGVPEKEHGFGIDLV